MEAVASDATHAYFNDAHSNRPFKIWRANADGVYEPFVDAKAPVVMVGTDAVYWWTGVPAAELWKSPKTVAAPRKIATIAPGRLTAATTDDKHLFWSTIDSIYWSDHEGAKLERFYDRSAGDMVSDGAFLYWLDPTGGAYRCSLAGPCTTATRLFASGTFMRDVWLGPKHFVWLTTQDRLLVLER